MAKATTTRRRSNDRPAKTVPVPLTREPQRVRQCVDRSDEPAAPPGSQHGQWNEKVQVHRRRQASVAAVLDQTFGRLAKSSPELWERRAYLMLVGLVYERLATNENEIPSEELIALAKVLAENRRAEARVLENYRLKDATASESPPTGELPDHFAELVRQVYGTNFQNPGMKEDGGDCRLPHADPTRGNQTGGS